MGGHGIFDEEGKEAMPFWLFNQIRRYFHQTDNYDQAAEAAHNRRPTG